MKTTNITLLKFGDQNEAVISNKQLISLIVGLFAAVSA